MNNNIPITNEIQNAIVKMAVKDENGLRLFVPNSRLDFSWDYKLEGFTKKGVKLSWMNGTDKVNVLGKIEDDGDRWTLYTEGWSYILRIRKDL